MAVILGHIQCDPFLQIFKADLMARSPLLPWLASPINGPNRGSRARQDYLTGAAEPSGTAGAKPHGAPRSDAATIHADAASKKVKRVSDH